MFSFSKGLSAVIAGLERLVTVLFLVLALLLLLLVGLRYVFNTTIIGGDEIAGTLFVYTTAFGATVGVARNTHIRISFLADALPALGRRVIDVINAAIVTALNATLAYLSIDWIGQVGGFETPVLNIPQGIAQASLPSACGLVALFSVCRLCAALFGREAEVSPQ